jgi:hypothetical protein
MAEGDKYVCVKGEIIHFFLLAVALGWGGRQLFRVRKSDGLSSDQTTSYSIPSVANSQCAGLKTGIHLPRDDLECILTMFANNQ